MNEKQPKNINIRPVKKTDADHIAHIIQIAFSEQASLLNINKMQHPNYVAFETPQSVQKRLENGDNIFIAQCDKIPIGTISYKIQTTEKSEIKRLAILPQYRGHSFGIKMMNAVETILQEQDIKHLELNIVAQFEKLRLYYEKMGYRSVETKRYPTLPFDVLIMSKLLS